jgi:hypothetical protein
MPWWATDRSRGASLEVETDGKYMSAVVTLAKAELGIVFASIACIVVMRLLTAQINLVGLMSTSVDQPVSPERAQLLVATLGAAGYLLLSTGNPHAQGITFPSAWFVLLFGGSHLTYLIAKYIRPGATASD